MGIRIHRKGILGLENIHSNSEHIKGGGGGEAEGGVGRRGVLGTKGVGNSDLHSTQKRNSKKFWRVVKLMASACICMGE